ncbi:WD-40 repeat family small nuclear ribonucleoprotein Prp4p-related [Cryptosporidium sp. chipmunk genotype I]|uniref:WD-40 repeat family small nuclear ribonucleoprotein Prp4p-related n=1 Tax=Cryptosporidium sp. chipmunk genotype I TaxID=1280935 RepID=UPI00351A1D93|nr:WD-40 repeat family small nuclear ribonucleoprotein Prp4p-related [Cryptosporidium sp. chipmunk genotype I]
MPSMNYLCINSAVSTNDEVVKLQLRELGEPICYFGEDQYGRRERLSNLIEKRKPPAFIRKDSVELPTKETFFSEGTDELMSFRKQILTLSIKKSYYRLKYTREFSEKSLTKEKNHFLTCFTQNIRQNICEMCDTRYVLGCCISPFEDKIATYGLSGDLKIWDSKHLIQDIVLKSHKHSITDVCWIVTDEGYSKLFSCDLNANIFLWNDSKVENSYTGHEDQVNRIVLNPLSKHFFSASSDETWRIWDIETSSQIQVQEGHSRPIFGLDVHPDGALVISGDSGGIFRVWDIRTGRSILSQSAHSKKIITSQFSPNCDATFVTSSQDNYIKIWDLRKIDKPLSSSLLGHSKQISKVQYEPKKGRYIASASLDESIKIWSTSKFKNDSTIDFTSNFSYITYSCIKHVETNSHKITELSQWD